MIKSFLEKGYDERPVGFAASRREFAVGVSKLKCKIEFTFQPHFEENFGETQFVKSLV